MQLPFLDRHEELARLKKLLARPGGSLGVLYGRRRLGKSRLLRQLLAPRRSVYYVGDNRESALQRASLSTEIARVIDGFDRVAYPDWDALFARWWDQAHGLVLALDEFPALAAVATEIPSLLQKHMDRNGGQGVTLLLAGSSQRLMQGLVLDRSAPLFGRATEILKISPLPAGWIQSALRLKDAAEAIEAYATWGGVPRYWELALDHADREHAVRTLVLAPLGILHEEPARLLLDDLRDTVQAASILSVIGQGAHRASEIAARLEKPITSLSRPLQRLVELELVRRLVPFGASPRESKRTLYQISDPFLRYWFRFVEPNRSRLEAGQNSAVITDVKRRFMHHVGDIWEDLARASVPRFSYGGERFGPAARWWGPGLDRAPERRCRRPKSCRVGACAIKLGQAALDRVRQGIDWSKPTATQDATALARQLALEGGGRGPERPPRPASKHKTPTRATELIASCRLFSGAGRSRIAGCATGGASQVKQHWTVRPDCDAKRVRRA